MSKLTTSEAALLATHERTIKTTQGAFIACGKALADIREQKLYRATFDSFEGYCQTRWGWGRQRALQLIEAAETVASLPPDTAAAVTTERVARALKDVPKEDRPAVVAASISSNGKASGAKIEAAKKVVSASAPTKICKPVVYIQRDETGYAIPDAILPLWNRRGEVSEVQKAIARAKLMVKEAHAKPDPLWQPVNMQAVEIALQNAKRDLDLAIPYAVCCTCQGRAKESCASCKGRGFISKHHFDVCVPEELKAIRQKSCAK